MNDNYQIGLDADDALKGAETFKQAVEIVNQQFVKLTATTVKYNAEGQQVGGTLAGIAQNGEKLSIALQRVNSDWKTLSTTMGQTKSSYDDAYASAKRFTDRVEQQSKLIKTSASSDEMLKYKNAISTVADTLAELDEKQRGMANLIWANVQKGQVSAYGKELQNLQSQLVTLKKAQDNLGSAAQTALQRQRESAAQLQSLYGAAKGIRATEAFVSGKATGLSTATDSQRDAYVAALSSLKRFQLQNQITTTAIQNMWQQLATTGPRAYVGQLAQVQAAVQRVMAANAALGAQAQQANAAAVPATVLISWRSLARFFEARILYNAVSEITGALRQGVSAAIEFGQKIGQIRTLSTDAGGSAKEWADSVKRISSAFGADAVDVAKSYYSALSNQIGNNVAEIENFTRQTQQFAQVTASTAEEANNLFASVINSYSLSVGQTTAITGELFKTIDLGRVTASEMANSIGRVLVPAKQLGLAYQEMFAGIAVLTQKGVSPQDAMTQLLNLMNKMIKPSQELKELFKEWGVETGQQAVATFGFTGVLQKLTAELNSNGIARLGELVNDIRGFRGVLGLAGENLQTFQSTLGQIFGSNSEYRRGIDETFNTPAKQMAIELNKAKNLFLEIGESGVEAAVGVFKAFGGLDEMIKKIGVAIAGTLIGGFTYFALKTLPAVVTSLNAVNISMRTLTLSFNALKAVMVSNPITLIAVAVGTLASVLLSLGSSADRAEASLADFMQRSQERVSKFNETIYKALAINQEAIKRVYQDLLKEGTKAATDLLTINRNLQGAIKGYADIISATKGRELDSLDEQISRVSRSISDARSDADAITALIKRVTIERDKEAFAETVAPGTAQLEKAKRYYAELTRLSNEYQESLRLGNLEQARLTAEEMIQREKEYKTLATEIKKSIATAQEDKLATKEQLVSLNLTREQIKEAGKLDTINNRQIAAHRVNAKGYQNINLIMAANRKTGIDLAAIDTDRQKSLLEYNSKMADIERKTNEIRDAQLALSFIDRNRIDALDQIVASEQTALDIAEQRRLAGEAEKKALKDQRQTIDDLYDQLIKLTKISLSTKTELFTPDQVVTTDTILQKYRDIKQQIREAGGALSVTDLTALDPLIEQQAKAFSLEERIKANVDATNEARERQLKLQSDATKRQEELNMKVEEQAVLVAKARADVLSRGGRAEPIFALRDFDVTTSSIEEQQRKLLELRTVKQQLMDALQFGKTAAVERPAVASQLEAIAAAEVAIVRYQKLKEELITAQKVVSDSETLFKPIVTATAQIAAESNKNVQNYNDLVLATQRLNAEAAALSQTVSGLIQMTPVPGRVVPVNRASGGYMHGQDRIPAMLAPGEFIMSAKNTRRFYSQLVGMNSGLSNMASGGAVGGTNIGDINISLMPSGNQSVDVVSLGRALKREIKRGTVRFQ